jgi:transposase
LIRLADWLAQCGVKTIAMESTGIYWIPLFDLLEARGFEVFLVNPRQSRHVPGRPKSDVHDCQWLQRLHSYGLLTASFRPAAQVVVLRSYLRQRQMLIRYGGQHAQHMQKALEEMNVKLPEVVSDVTGATGMAIIRAILRGQRDPLELAKLRNERCKRTQAKIARALYGNWRDEHLFALKQAVALYDFYRQATGGVRLAVASASGGVCGSASRAAEATAAAALPGAAAQRSGLRRGQCSVPHGRGRSDAAGRDRRQHRFSAAERDRPGREPVSHREELHQLAGAVPAAPGFGGQDP